MMQVSAAVRLIPRPPARVDSRNTCTAETRGQTYGGWTAGTPVGAGGVRCVEGSEAWRAGMLERWDGAPVRDRFCPPGQPGRLLSFRGLQPQPTLHSASVLKRRMLSWRSCQEMEPSMRQCSTSLASR